MDKKTKAMFLAKLKAIKAKQEELAQKQKELDEQKAKQQALDDALHNNIQYHKVQYEHVRSSYLLGLDITEDVRFQRITRNEYKALTGKDYVGYQSPYDPNVIVNDPITPEREAWEERMDKGMEELREQEEKEREEKAKNYKPEILTPEEIQERISYHKEPKYVISQDDLLAYYQGKDVEMKPIEEVEKQKQAEEQQEQAKVEEEVKADETKTEEVKSEPTEEPKAENTPKPTEEQTTSKEDDVKP